MLKFSKQQKVLEVGEVKVGGQPGENPTVLIGSIFHHGHRIVKDEKTGDFHKEDAVKLITLQEEFSDKTGNPCMLDVVGSTGEAMKKFISFVADVTEAPILVDSPRVEVKAAGVKHAAELGLEKRVVYNSLMPESKPREFETIKDSGVESAVLLTYKKGIMTSKARVKAAKDLLPKVEEAGVTKPLLDTFVMDIPSLSMACRAMLDLKREVGFP